MKPLDLNGHTAIRNAMAHASRQWASEVDDADGLPHDVRDNRIEVNKFFCRKLLPFNGRVHFEFDSDDDTIITVTYDFNTPEDELAFILRWC